MKTIDIETLRKRQEKIHKRRSQEADDKSAFGLTYGYIVDGRIYPVCAMFQLGLGETAKDKINYLIKGGKE